MANSCINTVIIGGEQKNTQSFLAELLKLKAENDNNPNERVIPDYVTPSNGSNITEGNLYISSIEIDSSNTDENRFWFESAWAPAIGTIKAMAIHHQVNIIGYQFEEPGNGVYGVYAYDFLSEVDVRLELSQSEVELFEFSEEIDAYIFEGKQYESSCDIIETLLNRKRDFYKSESELKIVLLDNITI